MSKLVIVESPNKIKSIEKFLGKDYVVDASKGHIVYLPSSGAERFGVDLETWEPRYKIDPDKKSIVDRLKKLAKEAEEVLIATDDDREGEAIADNLVVFLNIANKYRRVRFNEITEEAVTKAIANPGVMNVELVNSQIARRILDRMIGYKLSGIMRKTITNAQSSPSAGRVQSVALKVVVEREQEIDAFVPVPFVTLHAQINDDVIAEYNSGTYKDTKTWIDPAQKKEVEKSLTGALKVTSVNVSQRNEKVVRPLELSSLLRKSSTLGMTTAAVQRAAQSLYEGYGDGGLISYPRTDSTRLSISFIKKAQAYISTKFGDKYVAKDIKGSAGAQDAHEAIRPTNISLTPSAAKTRFNLSPAEFKVYDAVYKNTMQALMVPPLKEVLRYDLADGDHAFKMSSSKVIFDGYLKVTGYSASKELPKYQEGEVITVEKFNFEDKETQPPARLNEGSLVAKLKELGVGRPSTYSATVSLIQQRDYVIMENKALVPTRLGKVVLEKLLQGFSHIINEEYTASMEQNLDRIASGDVDHKALLTDFWKTFQEDIQTATQELDITRLQDIPAGKDCPKCGSALIVKTNKRDKTRFFACPTFPKCTHTESDPTSKPKFFRKWKKKA